MIIDSQGWKVAMRSRCSCHTIIWVHVWLRTSFDLSTGPTWRHPQPLASRPVQGKTVLSENTFLPVSNADRASSDPFICLGCRLGVARALVLAHLGGKAKPRSYAKLSRKNTRRPAAEGWVAVASRPRSVIIFATRSLASCATPP